MNLIEEAQLLKDNRNALIEQLNNLGFTAVDETTPLSKIADYIKWAGGLLDCRLAAISKRNNEYHAYTTDEWEQMSASDKASLIKLGIHIRAEGKEFIISKDNILRSNGATAIPWCASYVDVKGLTNYGMGSWGFHLDFDGKRNTDLILAHGRENGVSFEAAEQCRAYKAATFADGGYDDPTEWSLPAIGQLWMMYRYLAQINEAITYFFGTGQLIVADWHWSSTEFNSSTACYVFMNNGVVNSSSKTYTLRVRAVAPVPGVAVPAI